MREVFRATPRFSDLTLTQYEAAYAWLSETGLLSDLHSSVPARFRVFRAALAHSGAPWLPDADVLVRGPDELPGDALRAADLLEISAEDAFGQLNSIWGKLDTSERERIGAAGEMALLRMLTVSVDAQVEHVAAWADGFGYDIAVSAVHCTVHVETKTTIRRGRLSVYLSRNEFEVMLRDPAWELVAVRLTPSLEPEAVATVPREWIAEQAPVDRGGQGRWESCRLDVPPDIPVPGVPSLAPLLLGSASGLLSGESRWP
ncbi:DUF3883 domain-containing protein [Streptomyces sp. NPDC046275]|uniref:protein NO VEIN domain-containing protein n=1 Tax=Streptomyces sp. NPDC046275 TaxID=3157201 RepID=UPI0033C14464